MKIYKSKSNSAEKMLLVIRRKTQKIKSKWLASSNRATKLKFYKVGKKVLFLKEKKGGNLIFNGVD